MSNKFGEIEVSDDRSKQPDVFDLRRNVDGSPLRTKNGTYVLVKNDHIYLGISPQDAETIIKLLLEIVDGT
jgi:hypothetical protein